MEYIDREQAIKGVNADAYFEGTLRINPTCNNHAFVTVQGLSRDIYIDVKDRNRTFNGHKVVIQLHPIQKWIAKNDISPSLDLAELSIQDKHNGDAAENGSGDAIMQDGGKKAKGKKNKAKGKKGKRNGGKKMDMEVGDEKKVLICRKQMVENMILCKGLQPAGYVVYAYPESQGAVYPGVLKSMTKLRNGNMALDVQDRYVKFVPCDDTVPHMKIERTLIPASYQNCPGKYKKMMFACAFNSWQVHHKMPMGRYVRMIGQYGDVGAEVEKILLEQSVDHSEFPAKVIRTLKKYMTTNKGKWQIPKHEIEMRRDLRKSRIFTIDPSNARDLDDALHVTKISDKMIEIGVHIADVSYFLEEGGLVDQIAKERATSVYLVDRVIPMLPRMLCEELCSLNPDVDRLAVSVIWKMNTDGTMVDEKPWIGRTIINSCCKLDYQTAQHVIDNKITVDMVHENKFGHLWEQNRLPSGGHRVIDVYNDILLMNSVAMLRRKERYDFGALQLNKTKIHFQLDEHGNPIGYAPYPIKDSNRMIEEYMLLANVQVAKHLYDSDKLDCALLRNHACPNEEKLQSLCVEAKKANILIDPSSAGSLMSSMIKIKQEHGDAVFDAMNMFLINPMNVAKYVNCQDIDDPVFLKHYALNFPFYTHFTSPIRRYADVIVHRQLMATIRGNQKASSALKSDEVSFQVQTCNGRRKSAKDTQDACSKLYLRLYIKSHAIQVQGIVLSLGSKSFTVYLSAIGVEVRLSLPAIKCTATWSEEPRELYIKTNKCGKSNFQIKFLTQLEFKIDVTDTVPYKLRYSLKKSI